MVGVCENGIPPKADKPAQGGQAHQRRASSGVVHSGEKS